RSTYRACDRAARRQVEKFDELSAETSLKDSGLHPVRKIRDHIHVPVALWQDSLVYRPATSDVPTLRQEGNVYTPATSDVPPSARRAMFIDQQRATPPSPG